MSKRYRFLALVIGFTSQIGGAAGGIHCLIVPGQIAEGQADCAKTPTS